MNSITDNIIIVYLSKFCKRFSTYVEYVVENIIENNTSFPEISSELRSECGIW